MAKRKLYGAALAAYNRKRGRTTALVRRGPRAVARRASTKVRTRYVKVRSRRRRGSSGSGGVRPLRAQVWDLGAAAGYGYVTQASHAGGSFGAQAKEMLGKIPTLDAIGVPASHGLLFHFVAQRTGGKLRKVLGHLSHAALMRAAYNLGASGFDHEAAAKLSGEDDDDDVFAGAIDVDDDYDYSAGDEPADVVDQDDPGDE